MLRLALTSSLLLVASTAFAQESKFAIKKPDFDITTYAQMQGWGVYSMERSANVDGNPGMEKIEQRANIYIRRGRLGFKGQPYENLSYILSLYFDNAGHDALSSSRGGTLPGPNGGPATVGLWDSFLTWKLSDSDLFHLTGGYFRPQISRESITAAFNVNSFEKAINQGYVRDAVIGRSYGRGTGINLGGLSHEGNFGFNYNLGIFNKVTTGEIAETEGTESSLVYVGRVAMSFGDPEMKKYGIGYTVNYFGKRKGITVALNGSSQDETPDYQSSKVIGGDFSF